MKRSDKNIALVLAMVVVGWGLNVVMVKYLTQHMNPLLMSAVRMILAAGFFLPLVWRSFGLYRPTARQWLFILLNAATSIYAHQVTLVYGVSSTTATNASIILGLNPLTTALLAALFLGERMTLKLITGLTLGFTGVIIVVLASASGHVEFSILGDLIMFLSMLAYVLGGLSVKKGSQAGAPILIITAYSTAIGALLLNITALISFGPSAYLDVPSDGVVWLVMLLSAWGSTALGSLGWNWGIKHFGAGRTAMFLNGMPFASIVGAVIFLGETIEWIHIVAFLLTTGGIIIGTRKKGDRYTLPRPANTGVSETG